MEMQHVKRMEQKHQNVIIVIKHIQEKMQIVNLTIVSQITNQMETQQPKKMEQKHLNVKIVIKHIQEKM